MGVTGRQGLQACKLYVVAGQGMRWGLCSAGLIGAVRTSRFTCRCMSALSYFEVPPRFFVAINRCYLCASAAALWISLVQLLVC
jgi:hypothetical protein